MLIVSKIKISYWVMVSDYQGVKAMLESAEEILGYAVEEFDKAVRVKDVLLYRNAADKAFLALIVAMNAFIVAKLNVIPKNHSERRKLLRELGREDLRALYSDLMRTLHEEAFYEGVYEPEEVNYAIGKIKELINEFKAQLSL